MDDNIRIRDRIFSCFYSNTTLFNNFPEEEKKQKADEYLRNIFASAGVSYDNPDIGGLEYAMEILTSRSLIEGEESKNIIKKLRCFHEAPELG